MLRRDCASEVVRKIVRVCVCVQGRCQQEPRTVKTSEEEMFKISSDEEEEKKKPDSEGGRRVWRVERRKAAVCSRPLPTLGSGGDELPTH